MIRRDCFDMIDTYYNIGGEYQMTNVCERKIYLYCHIYKAPTITTR